MMLTLKGSFFTYASAAPLYAMIVLVIQFYHFTAVMFRRPSACSAASLPW